MVISGYAFVTGAFGTSDCSMKAAADSCPHPGLVELPNIVDATPPAGVARRDRFLQRLVLKDLEVAVTRRSQLPHCARQG